MVATMPRPSEYEVCSYLYRGEFREKSDEELRTIASESETYLEESKGFNRLLDILFGIWDDQKARKDVAQSLLEERAKVD